VYLLSQDQGIQEEARKDVQAALGDAPPGASDTAKLRLAESSFKEAMRIYPPA
jgi:hypothetical protein